MADNLIVALPTGVACSILQGWVDLKALKTLDSAFCSKAQRRFLLVLFQSEHFALGNHINVSNKCDWSWLIKRKVRVRSLVSTGLTNPVIVEKYLFNFGDTIRSIRLETQTSHAIVSALLAYCRDVECLQLCDGELPSVHVRHLLSVSRHSLTELHIQSMSQEYPLTERVRLSEFPVMIHAHTPRGPLSMEKLVKLQVLGDVQGSHVVEIAQLCPHLRSLGIRGTHVCSSTFKHIARICRDIVNIDVQGCACDDLMHSAVTLTSPLHSLNLLQCAEFGTIIFLHLHERSRTTLHTLHMEYYPEYFRILTILLEKCTKLRTLNVIQSCEGPSFVFSESIRNLTTLILGGATITDTNLIAVAQHCTELRTLSMYSATVDSIKYTDLGLHALVQGCPKLQLLVIRTDVHTSNPLTPFALNLWRLLRPRLIISGSAEYLEKLKYRVLDMPV